MNRFVNRTQWLKAMVRQISVSVLYSSPHTIIGSSSTVDMDFNSYKMVRLGLVMAKCSHQTVGINQCRKSVFSTFVYQLLSVSTVVDSKITKRQRVAGPVFRENGIPKITAGIKRPKFSQTSVRRKQIENIS